MTIIIYFLKFQFDLDKNGHITSSELGEIFKALGESVPGYKLREMIEQVDKDRNGTVEFSEFIEVKFESCTLCSEEFLIPLETTVVQTYLKVFNA